MKVFLSLALLAVMAFAEPPAYRQQLQGQRYYFARQLEEPSSALYPPSGWKPDGPAFNLPQRSQKQQQAPQVENAYGPPQEPQQQYGPPQQPQQQYGPPQQPEQQYAPRVAETIPSPRQQQTPQLVKNQQFARQQQISAHRQQQQQQQSRFNTFNDKQQQYVPPQQPQPALQQQYGAPQQPQHQYGAPQKSQQQYGSPQQSQQQYGAPDYTTTDISTVTEIDEPVTGGPDSEQSEPLNSANELREENVDIDNQQPYQQQRGEYYVALPDGRLQRVRYVSRQDLEAMHYFAKIRAENVEPLRGPIYAYPALQKLEVAPSNLQIAAAEVTHATPTLTVTAAEAKPQKLVAPKVDIKPLAQIQVQHDSVAPVIPLSSSFAGYSANYQVPAAPVEERYILAFP